MKVQQNNLQKAKWLLTTTTQPTKTMKMKKLKTMM